MPNHVCGIVVLVVFWDYRIGTWIPALSCCRGGFQTRPHGDASYGDTGIIVLARVFLHYRIWWAGLKPAPTGVRWGCCAQSRLRHRRIGGILGLSYWHGDFLHYHIVGRVYNPPLQGFVGLSCPITSTVLSYWWYFGIIVLARGSQHYRVVGAGLKPARTGIRHTGILALSYWHGYFCIIVFGGRV